jgi:putative membrane protein
MTTTDGWLAQMQTWHDGGMFGGMHWLWWLFWVATLLVIGWAFVRLGADRSESHRSVLRKESAEETLRQRFAAGEIDEEEYTRRMRVLREAPPGG